jgi:mycothiol synthase
VVAVELNAERAADPSARRHVRPGAHAQSLPGLHTWMLDWAFEPGAEEAAAEVLAAALADVDDGAPLQVWVRNPGPDHDRIAAGLGLGPARDLLQLRVPLPLPGPRPTLDWVPFRPGVDEDAWLDVNNRAFHWHPEQGGWTRAQIEAEEAEPWFDPAGFLLHWVGGRLAGFCWTKVHPATDDEPAMGEIYVIAAAPEDAGRGLGRALTTTGLDWLYHERSTPVGMLYVDRDNTPAVALYEKLGFTRHHVDRAYTAEGQTLTPMTDPRA